MGTPGPEGPSDGAAPERLLGVDGLVQGSEVNLWRRHLYSGISTFLLGAVLLLGYVALTPRANHRTAIVTLDVVAMLVWVLVVWPVGVHSLTAPWRHSFFFAWSVATLVIIGVAIGLDGGAASPLAGMLVLPVLFGGLLYRLPEVVGLAVVALAVFGLIFVAGPSTGGARGLATALMIGIAGSVSGMAAMNRQLGEEDRRVLTRRLHRLATYDGLTGCLNYQAFQTALANEAQRAERYGRPLTVVIADLDGFKAVNDRHGHAAGDVALTRIAAALLDGVRSPDFVGRIGGDEFVLLLPETSTPEAHELVERLRADIERAETPERVTMSFGLSTWRGPGDSSSELLGRADSALYEAKRHGRDRLAIAPPSGASPVSCSGSVEEEGSSTPEVQLPT